MINRQLVSQLQSSQFRLETCMYAVGLAAALLTVNVLPTRMTLHEHFHGWPFVFMVREGHMPVDFTWLYGPWPIYNPPLLRFDAASLTLNILMCVLLLLSSTVAFDYLLHRSTRRIQFSLRSLLVGTIGAGVGMAILHEFNGGLLEDLLLMFPRYVVWASICLALSAGAHWIILVKLCAFFGEAKQTS